jgi:hypothetical protein
MAEHAAATGFDPDAPEFEPAEIDLYLAACELADHGFSHDPARLVATARKLVERDLYESYLDRIAAAFGDGGLTVDEMAARARMVGRVEELRSRNVELGQRLAAERARADQLERALEAAIGDLGEWIDGRYGPGQAAHDEGIAAYRAALMPAGAVPAGPVGRPGGGDAGEMNDAGDAAGRGAGGEGGGE